MSKDVGAAGDAVREALLWYAGEAEAIARYMVGPKNPKADAILASVTVLALDAGKRARAALATPQAAPADARKPCRICRQSDGHPSWCEHSVAQAAPVVQEPVAVWIDELISEVRQQSGLRDCYQDWSAFNELSDKIIEALHPPVTTDGGGG